MIIENPIFTIIYWCILTWYIPLLNHSSITRTHYILNYKSNARLESKSTFLNLFSLQILLFFVQGTILLFFVEKNESASANHQLVGENRPCEWSDSGGRRFDSSGVHPKHHTLKISLWVYNVSLVIKIATILIWVDNLII
jgi:hypothetical protein